MGIHDILVAAGIGILDARVDPRPGSFAPIGIVLHHTANPSHGDLPSLHILQHGRSDLPGPLVQLGAGREGTIASVTDGRANHAGRGSDVVAARVRADVEPAAPGPDNTDGNTLFIGIEIENAGDGHDPYPQRQLDHVVDVCVALCTHFGWSPNRVIGHKEWTRRKPDPTLNMPAMRADIAAAILHPIPSPTPTTFVDESELAMLPRVVHWQGAICLVGYDNTPFDGTVKDAQGNAVAVTGATGPWVRVFPNLSRMAQVIEGGSTVTDRSKATPQSPWGAAFEVTNNQFEQVYVFRGAA